MIIFPQMETLKIKKISLRDSLVTSNFIHGNTISILDSFSQLMSSLDKAMNPDEEYLTRDDIREANRNIDRTLESLAVVESQLQLIKEADAQLLKRPSEDLQSYVEALDLLRSIFCFFSSNESFKKDKDLLDSVNDLISKAMQQLENDFESQLSLNSKPVEPDLLKQKAEHSQASIFTPHTHDNLGGNTLLHEFTQQLVRAGHQQQCFNIYRKVRVSALEESLKRLGLKSLHEDDVQNMELDDLEAKIGDWIHIMRIAVKVLFAGERKLCEEIFEGIDMLEDLCFTEVTTNSFITLVSFGKAIAKSKRSPEKLFVLLDMYEVMQELQLEIEKIFECEACLEMRESVLSLMKCISQTSYDTLRDFEKAVGKDAPYPIDHNGSVHPLTRYVISYVKFLFAYQSTLKQIFQQFETDQMDYHLATVIKRILEALQNNLDMKSQKYEDTSLGFLFHMNNTHHVVKSVRKSELRDLLGDDWIQRHRRIVQQSASQYKRVALSEITSCFHTMVFDQKPSQVEHDSSRNSVSQSMVKEWFKCFNMLFEEFIRSQSQCEVADSMLRDSLRISITQIVVPAYGSFVFRFGNLLQKSKNPKKYLKYTADDVNHMLSESLFMGGKLQKGDCTSLISQKSY